MDAAKLIDQYKKMDKHAQELIDGLTATEKYLSSTLFYDKKGLQLFSEIMSLPEYYLVNSEIEILNAYSKEIIAQFTANNTQGFNIIDLGAGNALKTQIILQNIPQNVAATYLPIDIDQITLNALAQELQRNFPFLSIKPRCGNYFEVISELKKLNEPKLVLFLGSSIGNYARDESNAFLTMLKNSLNSGDKLLIGFDLIKNPEIILHAYNDDKGITKQFNFNMLKRLNTDLDADFNLDYFMHYPVYDPVHFVAKSYLVSTRAQTVQFKKLAIEIPFAAWESIHTESSQKYTKQMIEDFARSNQFKIIAQYYDKKDSYVNSLWEVI